MSNRNLTILVIVAALIGTVLFLVDRRTQEIDRQEITQNELAETPADELVPEEAVEAPSSEDMPALETLDPTFDVVRVDRSGSSVIAGRAAPGSTVEILADGKHVAEVVADKNGEWVVVTEAPLDSGNQELSLIARKPDGEKKVSKQTVVVMVPERPGKRPVVVLTGEGTSKLLQGQPGNGAPVLDTLDYEGPDRIIFSGRASSNSTVRVYMNDQLMGDAEADEDGRWIFEPKAPVPPGVYTLRLDELNGDGSVFARTEMPVERAAPEKLAETASAAALGNRSVVVQPGNSLWRLARRHLGAGLLYTDIYDANSEQIRDPDLIYPGQIFSLPNGS